MRNWLLNLTMQRRQVFFLVLFLSTLPILRWFALILLSLVTLRCGAKAGSQLVLAIVIPLALQLTYSKLGLLPLLGQVANVSLLFVLSLLLHTTRSWLVVLQVLTVLGLVVVLGVHVVYPDIANFWHSLLTSEFANLNTLPAFFSGAVSEQDMPALLAYVSRLATGLDVMVLSAAALVNVSLGRYLQATLFNPGGLKKELYQIHLSPLYASALILILILGLMTHLSLLLDCVGVVLLPLTVAGLSLMHYLTAQTRHQSVWLVFCYCALLLLSSEVFVILIGASFVDAWWNIRQRYVFKR